MVVGKKSCKMSKNWTFQQIICVGLNFTYKFEVCCKESPAELMLLTFVLDKTASGTARSKTENELHSWSAPCFFVWDKTASGTARSKTENMHSIPFPMLLLAVPEAVSSHTKTRSRSAVQSIFCVTPRCSRGKLVPYKSEKNQLHLVLALLGTGAPMPMISHTVFGKFVAGSRDCR